jgi:poly-gamma-glutamate synthesis protein (capsule biosynthesis protein)
MLNNLISSLIAFLIALVPSFPVKMTEVPIPQITIIFTGDIMLGRSVMGAALDNNDSFYPFKNTADFLKNADITFANLENPIVKGCPRHVGGFKFCTTPEIADGLNFVGIDVVTLANNHTNNYGREGIEETKEYLTSKNINYVGQGNLVIKEVNETKFGFLGFDLVSNQFTFKDQELIASSDKLVDVLIVSPHWGTEYEALANRLQVTVAQKMVENGADLIIGHHPHWVQNNEMIGNTLVYYSLGNFIFDQMWSEETKKGLIVKMTFDPPTGETGAKLIKTEEFKTYIPKIGQPVLHEGV